jgi:DAK2 domain fusion protein YloV
VSQEISGEISPLGDGAPAGRLAVGARLDAQRLVRWAHLCLDALGRARAEIDALNVFPVPDGDTGTNLYLTQESAVAALDRAVLDHAGGLPVLDVVTAGRALAHGALLGARGNSGIIVSSLIRGLVEGLMAAESLPPARQLAAAFDVASASAYAAVATPIEGTILTVSRCAADAAGEAAQGAPDDVLGAVTAAAQAAREALARTPDQLPALKAAGVVDSGGRGLVVILDALEEIASGVVRPIERPAPLPMPDIGDYDAANSHEYEVMYLLAADEAAIAPLRVALGALGDSLVVVGEDPLWNVHVHVDDVGGAIEAGIEAGRPHHIRVTRLCDERPGGALTRGRAVVVVTHGPGTSALVDAAGATGVAAHARQGPSTGELLAGIRATGEHEVVVLTSDSDTRSVAEAAAKTARREGLRVAVIPTRSIVQSLAALAVHDEGASFDDDVVSMTRAAGATRYAAVTEAVREAITSAGRCQPGDVLGVVEGDVVEIGDSMSAVAILVLERLLQVAGELVTLVTGEGADEAIVGVVRRHLRREHQGVEVVVYDGGQPFWPLIVGVE